MSSLSPVMDPRMRTLYDNLVTIMYDRKSGDIRYTTASYLGFFRDKLISGFGYKYEKEQDKEFVKALVREAILAHPHGRLKITRELNVTTNKRMEKVWLLREEANPVDDALAFIGDPTPVVAREVCSLLTPTTRFPLSLRGTLPSDQTLMLFLMPVSTHMTRVANNPTSLSSSKTRGLSWTPQRVFLSLSGVPSPRIKH